MSDEHIASEELRKKRLDTCKRCPNYKLGVCKLCGCIMKMKTAFKMADCPAKRWEE